MDIVKQVNTRDWLRYIQNEGSDLSWLAPHEEALISLIQRDLYRDSEFHRAYDLLLLVFPYFGVILEHLDEWLSLLMDALLQAQSLRDNERQVQILRWIGRAHLITGKHHASHDIFAIALERADEGKIDHMMMASYAGLLKLYWFDLRQPLIQQVAEKAMEIVQRVEDFRLKGELYDALAFAYARIGETQMALGYGQMAYVLWNAVHDSGGIGRTAFTLAEVYRYAARYEDSDICLERALDFLEIARSNMAKTQHVWQHALIAYTQASIYFQRGQWPEAESWYQIALEEAVNMNRPQYVVVVRHGMGLTQAKLGQFDPARRNLQQALTFWKQMNNLYEQANVLYGLADLEVLAGNIRLARDHLKDALELCSQLNNVKDVASLRDWLQLMLDNLPT
jgi:tetratricopeptide (TPR) repeat protein